MMKEAKLLIRCLDIPVVNNDDYPLRILNQIFQFKITKNESYLVEHLNRTKNLDHSVNFSPELILQKVLLEFFTRQSQIEFIVLKVDQFVPIFSITREVNRSCLLIIFKSKLTGSILRHVLKDVQFEHLVPIVPLFLLFTVFVSERLLV